MLDHLKYSPSSEPRLVILGAFPHNPDELGRKILPRPYIGKLQGFIEGFKDSYFMIDRKAFEPKKTYIDSKVCNVMSMRELYQQYCE